MSGGHWDYIQFRFDEIASDVDNLIADGQYGHMEEKTVERIKETAKTIRRAGLMLQRVDWFVSGDDGEESFNERWNEEIA